MGNERGRQLCVIIPTYNNAGTVRQVIDDVLKYCPQIIVVNDGSTDGTSAILKMLPSTVTVVSYERNRGKGHALVAGFRKALEMGFSHAITIDADGQHFADDIPHLIEALDHHKDAIIVGTRNLTEKNMPRQNTFANRFSNFWFRLQTGIDLQDTQSGYRLYTLSQLRGLSLITSRYEAELELLVYAAWAGTQIISVPVKVYYPPAEERVSHFRPVYDFVRISILNTFLCIAALFVWLKQWAYTIFSFVYFLGFAVDMTIRGFFLITLGGGTKDHKLKYHTILQRKSRFVINHVPGTTFSYSNPHGVAERDLRQRDADGQLDAAGQRRQCEQADKQPCDDSFSHAVLLSFLLFMICFVAAYLIRPEYLFEQYDPRKPVRQRHVGQRQRFIRPLQNGL